MLPEVLVAEDLATALRSAASIRLAIHDAAHGSAAGVDQGAIELLDSCGIDAGAVDLAWPHNVKYILTTCGQVVGNDAPVTAPPYRLGAHDGAGVIVTDVT